MRTNFIRITAFIIAIAFNHSLLAAHANEYLGNAHSTADLWSLYITAITRAVAMNNDSVSESGKSHAKDLQEAFDKLEELVLGKHIMSMDLVTVNKHPEAVAARFCAYLLLFEKTFFPKMQEFLKLAQNPSEYFDVLILSLKQTNAGASVQGETSSPPALAQTLKEKPANRSLQYIKVLEAAFLARNWSTKDTLTNQFAQVVEDSLLGKDDILDWGKQYTSEMAKKRLMPLVFTRHLFDKNCALTSLQKIHAALPLIFLLTIEQQKQTPPNDRPLNSFVGTHRFFHPIATLTEACYEDTVSRVANFYYSFPLNVDQGEDLILQEHAKDAKKIPAFFESRQAFDNFISQVQRIHDIRYGLKKHKSAMFFGTMKSGKSTMFKTLLNNRISGSSLSNTRDFVVATISPLESVHVIDVPASDDRVYKRIIKTLLSTTDIVFGVLDATNANNKESIQFGKLFNKVAVLRVIPLCVFLTKADSLFNDIAKEASRGEAPKSLADICSRSTSQKATIDEGISQMLFGRCEQIITELLKDTKINPARIHICSVSPTGSLRPEDFLDIDGGCVAAERGRRCILGPSGTRRAIYDALLYNGIVYYPEFDKLTVHTAGEAEKQKEQFRQFFIINGDQ